MLGRTPRAALAALVWPLVGCLLTTSLDNFESGAGGASPGSGAAGGATSTSSAGGSGAAGGSGGSGPVTVLVQDQDEPNAIALDDEYVYFSTADSFIKRVPKDAGGPVEIIDSGQWGVGSLAVAGEYVWWQIYANPNGAVWRGATNGSGSMAIVTDQNLPTEIALSDSLVYWTTTGAGGQIRRADAMTGANVEPALDVEAFFFTVHGKWLYYTTGYTAPGPTGQIWAVELNTSPTSSLLDQNVLQPAAVAADANHVVWAQEGDGIIAKATAPTLVVGQVAANQTAPFDVALDEDTVYWTDPGAGRVSRAAVVDGEPFVIAEDGDGSQPWKIAVDASSVYWTDKGTGQVLKAPK